MGTSGVFNFALNGNQIISLAYDKNGMIPMGEQVSPFLLVKGREWLNIIQNSWIADDIRFFDYQETVIAPVQSSFVYGDDGNIYICKLSHTATADTSPVLGSLWMGYWDLKNFFDKGDWVSGTNYNYGDLVTGGFICIIGHTAGAITTANTKYWSTVTTFTVGQKYTSWNRIIFDTTIFGKVFDILELEQVGSTGMCKLDVTKDFTFERKTVPYLEFKFEDKELNWVLRCQYTTFAESVNGPTDNVDYNPEVYMALILRLACELTHFTMRSNPGYLSLKKEADDAFKDAMAAQGNKGSIQMGPKKIYTGGKLWENGLNIY